VLLLQKSATVAENGETTATVAEFALFCDSVDRLLDKKCSGTRDQRSQLLSSNHLSRNHLLILFLCLSATRSLTVQYVGQTLKIQHPFQQVGPQDVQTAEQQAISINLAQYYLVLTKGR